MEHPVKDIRRVIGTLTQGSPQEQEETLSRYFTPSASLVHPFCRVPHFDNIYIPRYGLLNSREIIQYIYKWYKILSPKIDIEVESAVFDQKSSLLYVNVAQTFTIWFLPFHKAPVRLVTVLHLVSEDKFKNNYNKSRHPRRALAKQQVTDNDSDHSGSLEGPSYASVAAGDATPKKTEEGIPMAHPPNPSNPVAVENAPVASARASGEVERLVDGFNEGNNSKRYLITKQEDFYQVNDWLKFVFSSPGVWVWYTIQVWNSILCVVGVVLFEPLIRAIGIRREGGGKPKWT